MTLPKQTETFQEKIDTILDTCSEQSLSFEHANKQTDKAIQEFRERIKGDKFQRESTDFMKGFNSCADYILTLIGEKK